MRNLITITATVLIFGTALAVIEQDRELADAKKRITDAKSVRRKTPIQTIVRAPGRIEGRTRETQVRARIAEQIQQIHVSKGQWVSAGDPLLTLHRDRLASERDLAAALLAEAQAERARLENGYRSSEIESARQEYQAMKAKLDGAEKSYGRAVKLSDGNAISQQSVDDRLALVNSLRATTAAAKYRLETVQAPPRVDELLVADASIHAAQARLRTAQIDLDRTEVKAPIDGKILAVEARVGELTGPDSQPLLIMSDTRQLRAVAEVDEYDAMRINTGQACEITSDGSDGILARGKIVELEPQMRPKRLFGRWAGERNDTYARRVWIELENKTDLPIGLPVDVTIDIR